MPSALRPADIPHGTDAGTWEFNVRTGEARFSERWASILGYTLEELGPVSVATWDGLLHPDDYPTAQETLQAHLRG